MKIITGHKSILSFFLVLSLFLQGCRVNTGAKSITRSGFFFDTLVNITIYDTDDETLLDECFDLCDDYEHMLSITLPGSDISRINAAGTEIQPFLYRKPEDTLTYQKESSISPSLPCPCYGPRHETIRFLLPTPG